MAAHGLVLAAVVACDRTAALEQHDADFDDPRQSTFVPAPDFGDETIIGCDLFLQDCPAGFKCAPWANSNNFDATKCAPVSEDAREPGAPCDIQSIYAGFDDCERGSMCWDLDPATGLGTCHAMVLGGEDNPMCANAIDVEWLGDSLLLSLCLPGCDPLAPDCPPGDGCYAGLGSFACLPTVPRDAGFAEPCEWDNECEAGSACIEADVPGCDGEPGCCSPFCDLDDPECPVGTDCHPWDPPVVVPGQQSVGICRV